MMLKTFQSPVIWHSLLPENSCSKLRSSEWFSPQYVSHCDTSASRYLAITMDFSMHLFSATINRSKIASDLHSRVGSFRSLWVKSPLINFQNQVFHLFGLNSALNMSFQKIFLINLIPILPHLFTFRRFYYIIDNEIRDIFWVYLTCIHHEISQSN